MRRAVPLLALLAAALAGAPAAAARVVHAHDAQGRSITFDVEAPNVDVGFYRQLLSAAAHGSEISHVRIRIMSPAAVTRACGTVHAAGCYTPGVIVVPTGRDSSTAHTLLHEYGHHLDASRGVAAVIEPNGTAHWWQARGLERLERLGRVTRDYSHGWSHSIGEIFAEDYAYLNLDLPYEIGWLAPPGPIVRAALRRDVAGIPEVSQPPPPLLIARSGTLHAGADETVDFGLVGAGRRVTVSAALVSPAAGATGRLALDCAGRKLAIDLTAGHRTGSFDERGLGPDFSCRASLAGGATPVRFVLRVRLAVERPKPLTA
jgi:hypothetical protein